MGGSVPLGYSCIDRKLVVNESEASTVRTIFDKFLCLGTVHGLADWLREKNIKTRRGNYFLRGPLYLILRNPIYLGLTKHKKETYPGDHSAIIDREAWDKVQSELNENLRSQRRKARATKISLFNGMLFDANGTLYTPTHATKYGRRYRYYTSRAVIKKTEKTDAPDRVPAPDLEKAVIDRILDWLQSPAELLGALLDNASESSPGEFFTRIVSHAAETAGRWRMRIASDRTQFLRNVVKRLTIHSDRIEIWLHVSALVNEILGVGETSVHLPEAISIECAFHYAQRGRALRLIIANTSIEADANCQPILKAISRARLWYEQITSGETGSIAKLAIRHGVTPRYIRMHMKLVQLSPQSIETLMNRPGSLTISLEELLANVPMNWNEQGFGISRTYSNQQL